MHREEATVVVCIFINSFININHTANNVDIVLTTTLRRM